MDPEKLESIKQTIIQLVTVYGVRVLAGIAILFFGWWGSRIVRSIVNKVMTNRKVEPTIISFVCNLVYTALMAFVFIAVMSQVGVHTTSFVAVIGAAGLAIGLALQGSLANFASGFLLIVFRPFKKGDYIEAAGTAGIVEEIQVFTSVLKTPDNKKVIIPNSRITSDNIVNYSANPTRRLDMVFGVSYGDDIKKVKQVLMRIAQEDPRIEKDPAPAVLLSEFGDSSVNFILRVWVKTGDYWGVNFDTREKVKLAFDTEDITIPFPQRDVHLFQSQP